MDTQHRTSAVIEDTPEGLRVTMRPPKNGGCLVAFLTVWLIGWTYGGLSAMRALADSLSPFNLTAIFLLVWLAGWLAGEVFAVAAIAFSIGG
ncbi:MAG: hypothetical protein FDZ75_06945, partial [Actinobacteria bacterium]